MRPTRALTLKKERLAELAGAELVRVGGAAATQPACPAVTTSLDLTYCASKVVECDSYLRPCISHTCTI